MTPLLTACDTGHCDAVKILIKAGANINQANEVRKQHVHVLSLFTVLI